MKLHTLYRGFLAALAIATATPALAQTAPAAPSTVVNIFGHRKGLLSDSATFVLNPHLGSSCAFSIGVGRDTYVGGRRMRNFAPFGDASQSGPPVEPQGTGLNRPEIASGALEHGGYYDGQDWARLHSGSDCTASDYAFAAGRAEIARRDTLMRDAIAAYRAGDYDKAFPLYKAAYAKLGTPEAADMQGQMYLLGQGTPRDTAKAIVWLKKATESFHVGFDEQRFNPDTPDVMNGYTEAAMTLAKIYAIGWDVPTDAKQARHWFNKADTFGYIPAAYVLGKLDDMHYGDEGTLTDAVRHLTRAARIGYGPAQYELGVIYYSGGDGVVADTKRGQGWLVTAANGGNADALYAVGHMYDLGEMGGKPDPDKALSFYKSAAVKGQPDAQEAIGLSFYQGQGLAKDDKMARMWFEHAAEGGSPDAMFNLAVMEARGEGGKADPVAAYAWMRLAQSEGLDKAGPAADELAGKLTPEEKAKADAALRSGGEP